MKNFVLFLILLTATTAMSQNQKPKGEDNRAYTFREISEKPELEGKVTFTDYFKKHFKSPTKITTPLNFAFTVEKNGIALNAKLPEGTDAAIVNEAKRVLKAAGKWKPGQRDGHAVRVNYVYTIQ